MNCVHCGKEISLWESYPTNDGKICNDCYKNSTDLNKAQKDGTNIDQSELDKILLTTETYSKDFEIEERLGVISSESALGMNIFRDIFTNVRDIVGGKSVSTQKILKDLKNTAFQDLKGQAYELDANAVVAIDLDYSEFSGAGRSMLFLVATGTAVRLKQRTPK